MASFNNNGKLAWTLTVVAFVFTVGTSIVSVYQYFIDDPDVPIFLSKLGNSFANFGVIYSYLLWTIFLLIYSIVLFYEHAHGLDKPKPPEKLKAQNYFYTLWFWGLAAQITQHTSIVTGSILPIEILNLYHFNIIAAIAFGIAGMVMLAAGRIQINGYWTTHIYEYDNQKLVDSGIYSKVRHPVYGGQCYLMIGILLACNNLWLIYAPVLTIFYNVIRARREEAVLNEILPGAYTAYKHKCPTFMFPFSI